MRECSEREPQRIKSVGEDVEKLELQAPLAGPQNGTVMLDRVWELLQKLHPELPHDLAGPLLGTHGEGQKMH